MSSDSLVMVENVSKKYCRSLRQSMLYAAADIGRDAVGFGGRGSTLRPGEFWAVDGISFEVKRGECLGIIGANGAGKSTLLKMLNGIVRPDMGRIRMRGRVGALIEVGAGFHPMLSGRENIYVNGAILGMSKREINRKFDSIVDFAELSSDVLDAPVKTYSSGMYVRLGFAIAAHCEPDVLLIDEVLSVGDIAFVGKCRERITQLVDGGTAVILVSHRMTEVELICAASMLLESGRATTMGTPHAVVRAYRSLSAFRPGPASAHRGGGSAPWIEDIRALDAEGCEREQFRVGETCVVEIQFRDRLPDAGRELRVWLWRNDLDCVAGTAAIPFEALRPLPWNNRLTCRVRLMTPPGPCCIGAHIVGEREHEYVDLATSREFAVEPATGGRPFAPADLLDPAVLDLSIEATNGHA